MAKAGMRRPSPYGADNHGTENHHKMNHPRFPKSREPPKTATPKPVPSMRPTGQGMITKPVIIETVEIFH